MTLDELNQLTEAELKDVLMQCCTAMTWVKKLSKKRPFINKQALVTAASSAWQNLAEQDYLSAFEGHPKIGDVNSLRDKYANTKALASGEQSQVDHACEQVLADLSSANDRYLAKFGFIFIVCATGKTAPQMLTLLLQRLPNDRETEIVNAAEEQRKIFEIRLDKLIRTTE